jgi:YD repeat-containing protein
LWEYFHRSDVDFWDSQNRLVTLVLVFDQFEERFTLGRQSADIDAQAEVCLTELSQLVENRPPPLLKSAFETQADAADRFDFDKRTCKVILSLREDFLPELETVRDRFPSILENSMRLQAMSEAQAMDVVLGPGSRLVTEPVAREIVRFVGRADQQSQACFTVEPVLLSVVLYGLNQRRRQNQLATITSDLLLGNRDQILDGFYEDALEGLSEKARLLVEDGLLTSSGRRDSLAWEDALAEFGVDEQDLLTLIDRHLLRREDRSDGARIELVHDRLADVVRKHRDSRRQRERDARELADVKARKAELEREKERQRRKYRRLLVACVALAVFAGALSGYIVWNCYRNSPHAAYFSTYTQRNGIFEGVGPLSKEQVSRRSSSFKFIRQGPGGRLVRVQAIDSEGRLTHRHSAGTYMKFRSPLSALGIDENPSRDCQWEFVQDEAGEVAYQLAYDKNGSRVWGLAYSPSLSQGLQKVAHFVGPDGLPNTHTASAAEYIRLEYWPDGLERQLSYLDRTGKPRSGPDGVYAVHYDYDALGLTKRVVSMDIYGHPMIDNDGVAILEITRDAMGNRTEEIALDAAGKPAVSKRGWSRAVMTYDEYGNQTGLVFYDTSGRPCLTTDGYAKGKLKYDRRGNAIEVAYFDTNDQPCLHKQVGAAKIVSKYDERGNQIEATCFGTNGKPCLNKYGNAKETHKFDERGNLIEAACFDIDDKPCLLTVGVSKMISKFDERSNLVAIEWYGIDGRRCLKKEGYAKMTADYDERGNQIECAYFGLGDEPVITESLGFHRVKKSYDEPGKCIAWEYYGVDGKRCMIKDGYAKATADYDERGNQVAWACFGLHDKPAINKADGSHRVDKSYDCCGNCIAWEYYGVDSKRCLNKDGYAKKTAIYDKRGNRIEEAYFDEAGKPVRSTSGYARVATSYDARGNVIGAAYFDERGKPMRSNDGFVRLTASYDERGNKIEVATFDEGGQPAQRKDGYARFTAGYDQRGNEIEEAYFDEAGKPVRSTDGYARLTMSYDARGNVVGVAYFDEAGKPVRSTDGYARFTASYDERGNKIEWACFGLGNEPAIDKSDGTHRVKESYDESGNCTAWEYYGVDGKPCLTKDGYARITANYDDFGRQLKQVGFDLTGNSTVKNYDQRGQQIEEAYFNEAGNPATNKNGIARWIAKGSEGTNQADITYFGRDGTPIAVQIYVSEVLPDGQAKEKGVAEGDILVSYDGKPVRSLADLPTYTSTPGDTIRELIVSRDGRSIGFKVRSGKIGIATDVRAARAAQKMHGTVK